LTPIRILFVIPYFYPAWRYGGPPRSAYDLAAALARGGHRIEVITTDSGGSGRLSASEFLPPNRIPGLQVRYYRNISNNLAWRHRLFWPPAARFAIGRRIQQSDIVHIHEFRSMLTVWAASAARRHDIPYVLSPHGGIRRLGKAWSKAVFDRLAGRRILRDASAVAAVSDLERKECLEFGVERTKIFDLPNPAPDVREHNVVPGLFRKKWRIEEERIVLFLGRLNRIKGADLLLHALKKLETNVSIKIVIAGADDGQEAELRRQIQQTGIASKVILAGFLDGAEKASALADADLLVVPSRSEIFSMAAVEALSAGVPVLLSSACGLPSLLDEQYGVSRFDTENEAALSAKVFQALNDGNLRASAKRAAAFVREEFSADRIAQSAESQYRACLAAHRRHPHA
jgi:glycosyltransferase involved in cell wall biosynthesis